MSPVSKISDVVSVPLDDPCWERMVRAVEKVKERLARATAALLASGIPYAVAGGNAVATWVATVDAAAVRNTRDVDILLRRDDLPRAREALTGAGFVYRHAAGIHMFLDGPGASARDAVHILFAGEKVRVEYLYSAPEISEAQTSGGIDVLSLSALVRMKLTSFRDKDRTHIRDLIELELVDQSWVDLLPAELAARLQALLDTPEG